MKNISKKELTEKELLFCRFFTSNWNIKEAIKKAGFSSNPEKTAMRLLSRNDIKQELHKLNSPDNYHFDANIKSGFERLAFGSIADALKLLFLKEPDFDLFENMDFFNISEIKKTKDGGMEIKFFDRFKALEKLSEISEKQNTFSPPLLDAIMESSKVLSTCDKCD